MCKLCDYDRDEMANCQFCGKLVCYDVRTEDDIASPACATTQGDLACLSCAREAQEAEERQTEAFGYYEEDDLVPEIHQ